MTRGCRTYPSTDRHRAHPNITTVILAAVKLPIPSHKRQPAETPVRGMFSLCSTVLYIDRTKTARGHARNMPMCHLQNMRFEDDRGLSAGTSLVVSAWHTLSLVLFTGSEATPLEKLGKKTLKQMSYSQTLTGWLVDRSSL